MELKDSVRIGNRRSLNMEDESKSEQVDEKGRIIHLSPTPPSGRCHFLRHRSLLIRRGAGWGSRRTASDLTAESRVPARFFDSPELRPPHVCEACSRCSGAPEGLGLYTDK